MVTPKESYQKMDSREQALPATAGKIAIGRQLRHCPTVLSLGPRSTVADYSPEELTVIRKAAKIYFPTRLLAEPLAALGKNLFPSIQTYRFCGDKILQTHLFQVAGMPVPRTGIYYGPRQQSRIMDDFSPPFIAKVPRGSSRGLGVFLIHDQAQLFAFLRPHEPAYIQEYLPIARDLRVVILGQRIVHAYWREAESGDFRTNVTQGGRISLSNIPKAALDLARNAAGKCRFDHVGLDLCEYQTRWYLLEANMIFGLEGFAAAGLNYRDILKTMVERDEI